MPRRSGPTLYEVMSQSSPSARPTSSGRPSRAEIDRPTNSRLLTPGSVVRIPVGFVWIGIVLGLILLVTSYWMGSQRGFEQGRAEGQQVGRSMQEVARTSALRREPEAGSNSIAQVQSSGSQADSSPSRDVASGDASLPRKSALALPGGAEDLDRTIDVGVERRQPGWTYKVVLYTKLEFAREVAESIRENGVDLGVDAMVEKSNNGRFGTVILLPGSPGSFTEQQMIGWDRRIEELAERVADEPVWSGKRPFPGHYPETYVD